MSRKSVVDAKVLELITDGDRGGGVAVAALLHQVSVQGWSRDRLVSALGRLRRRGRVTRVQRGKEWYYSSLTPRAKAPGATMKRGAENKARLIAEEFAKACLNELHPEGPGQQLDPVTIPAQIAQLRRDMEEAKRLLGAELERRHVAEQTAATMKSALALSKDVHEAEVARLNKLLEDERKASADLLKRVEAVQLVVRLALG